MNTKIKTFTGNGILSRDESGAHTGFNYIFKNFDSNHDGVLTKDESVEKLFAYMDQNGKLQ